MSVLLHAGDRRPPHVDDQVAELAGRFREIRVPILVVARANDQTDVV